MHICKYENNLGENILHFPHIIISNKYFQPKAEFLIKPLKPYGEQYIKLLRNHRQ